MTEITTINLFYPLLFLLFLAIVITIGVVCVKGNDNNLFGNIFNKHADEHIDTTDKFSKAHTEVIAHLPETYEKELHVLESDVKDIQERLIQTTEDINHKLDLLIERVAKLENIEYNKDNI